MDSDEVLARRIRDGDEEAFLALIRRHERSLAALIHGRIGSGEYIQDVLQDTLLHVWTGLRHGETPRKVRPWILQVARNRCRDYLRSKQRREVLVETRLLEPMVNRFGLASTHLREAAEEVVDAIEEVSKHEREALKSFYLDGLTIAEIAARHQCPAGTVKRRLSHGRDHVRAVLGIKRKRRSAIMDARKPFPEQMPEVKIQRIGEDPFDLDFREMSWWFVLPEVGDEVRWASYEPPGSGQSPWKLSETVEMSARRKAVIHLQEGVEIEVEQRFLNCADVPYDRNPNKDKTCLTRMWGRLTDDEVEWLAVETIRADGTRELTTFLDEGFNDDWDSAPRRIKDRGYVRELGSGAFERADDVPDLFGAGKFAVTIGQKRFDCFRLLNIEKETTERDVLVEAYVTEAGRTVLFRRYNGNSWAKSDRPPHNWGTELTWAEDLPFNDRIVIDGMTFVHYYDSLTDVACGISE